MAQSKKQKRDASNDFTGGRDSLGPVHPPSFEEEQEAAARMSEAARRWGAKNRRTVARQKFALEEVLLMMDVKKEASVEFDRKYKFRDMCRKSDQWYGRSDERS